MSKDKKTTKKKGNREKHHVDPAKIREAIKSNNKIFDKEIRYKFANIFNDLLYDRDISQEILSENATLSTGVISKYRNGKSEPSIGPFVKLAKELNVSINSLVGEAESRTYSIQNINKLLGLNEEAIRSLYQFHHNSFANINDFDNVDIPISKENESILKILNLIISNSGGLLSLLSYIEQYIEKSNELKECENNLKLIYDGNTPDNIDHLAILDVKKDDVDTIKYKVQRSLFENIDMIIDKFNNYKEDINNLTIIKKDSDNK